jgi:hypothetical protein
MPQQSPMKSAAPISNENATTVANEKSTQHSRMKNATTISKMPPLAPAKITATIAIKIISTIANEKCHLNQQPKFGSQNATTSSSETVHEPEKPER